MSVNEKFIRTVFEGMVECKPRLAAFLDEDDDMFDIRELSNLISKSFPWPIGVEVRRLLAGNQEVLNKGRIDQIFKIIERTLQYLSFVFLIQLYDQISKNNGEVPSSFKDQFKSRFTTLSMGNYVWLIRSVLQIMESNEIDPFMDEVKTVFSKKFLNTLDYWPAQRNELSHYQVNLTDEEIEVRCNEYLDELASLLTSIAFLIKYPLITITEIELIKPKNEEVHYMHNMLILNSASSSFIGKNELHHKYVDTHSVILVKSLKNLTHDFLNLSPLIIDTYSERMESREKLTKVKKDIYLYSKWDMKRQFLQYIGTEAEEKPDIRMVSFYDRLVKNYEDIMSKFSVTE